MGDAIKLSIKGKTAIVSLEDKESRNTFTLKFVSELKSVFSEIDSNANLHTVLVHGYDNYFCCGGSQEELLRLREAIDKNVGNFSDLGFYDTFIRCRIPVIAAMQGHAIGGGLALALLADVLILGEECIYSANFMRYGFTPGMGITLTLPIKFGHLLGNEMLMTAANYYGAELKSRCAPVRIVQKSKVIDTAFSVAEDLNEKPRLSLITLKENQTREILEKLPGVLTSETGMHKKTFLQPEVLEKIKNQF